MTLSKSPAGARLVGTLLAFLLASVPASAQQSAATATGAEVLRGTVVNDGEPVPAIEVTLHRVRTGESGAVARRTTDDDGTFTFELPPPDTSGFAVFFATAEYQGARYFGRAIHQNDVGDEYTVEVFDSTSTVPQPIRISRRDMVLVPQPDGGWEVDEAVRIQNPNSLTLVSPDGASPAWEFRIPEGVEAFEVGEGEVPADVVRRMGSRIFLMLPLVPGTRVLYIRYQVPGSLDQAVLPFDSPTDSINVFIRQPSPSLSVTGLTSTNLIEVGEEEFLQYSATGLPAGTDVVLEWESRAPPIDPIVAAVGVTILLLTVAAVAAARGGRRPPGPGASEPSSSTRDLAAGPVK